MRILFIGGTGTISSACSDLAVKRGYHLTLLNRGKSELTPPAEANLLQADIRDQEAARAVLGNYTFDVVVDWVAFTPDHVRADLELFRGRMGQYVFISSASVYQTPPANLPIRESTPLDNPIWEYSQNKIACEDLLVKAYREQKVPITIVRPSHTYDRSYVPVPGRYTVIDRMLKHLPVIVQGDGTSIWTLTHNADFAKGFIGLLGNSRAIGEAFHITSDEWLSWNQIYQILASAAGVEPRLVHIPSDLIAAYDADMGASLLGDKSISSIFDNSKLKQVVPDFCASIPFSRGAEEIIAWHRGDPSRQGINPGFNALCDRILSNYQKAWPA